MIQILLSNAAIFEKPRRSPKVPCHECHSLILGRLGYVNGKQLGGFLHLGERWIESLQLHNPRHPFSMMIGVSGIQWVNNGAERKAVLRSLNTFQHFSEKSHLVSLWVSRVRGITISE